MRAESVLDKFRYNDRYVDRKQKEKIANDPSAIKYIWHDEEYCGDWSIDDAIKFLEKMASKYGDTAKLDILNHGESWGVSIEMERPYTEEEKAEARAWLEANPEKIEGPIKWRDLNPLVDFPEEL